MLLVLLLSILKEKGLSLASNAVVILVVTVVILSSLTPTSRARFEDPSAPAYNKIDDLPRARINGEESSFKWLDYRGNN
jgi:hypothetical protein